MARRARPPDPAAAIGPLFELPAPRRPQPKFKNPIRPVWSENKARFIARYLKYFVFVTKHGTYIDGFAGPQNVKRHDMWTAKLVLESEPRWFRHFYLFEIKRRKVRALEQLRDDQPPRNRQKKEPRRDVQVIHDDVNVALPSLLATTPIRPKEAVFCLLDQHTFECHWSTLAEVASYPKAEHKNELLYFLPSYWLPRAIAGLKDTSIIERWWGRSDWSVNAEYVGRTWEHGTPLPSKRVEAAAKMKEAGWPVRFRLDPMVPYPDWREGYAETIDRINALEPEMVTIGALRATSAKSLRRASEANGRDASIFDYLTEERDPSGFKYRIRPDLQLELFRFAIERLAKGSAVPALCKEDASLWTQLGMKFRGCHCLLGADDPLAKTGDRPTFPALAPRSVRRPR